MIHKVEALNYRCFNYVGQRLNRFQVLVGPNSSGKTSFLDLIAFLGDLVRKGVDGAIKQRTRDLHDLVWGREGGRFELALEVSIPQEILNCLPDQDFRACRYEVVIASNPESDEAAILSEKALVLLPTDVPRDNDHFYDETGHRWDHAFKLGSKKSALGNLPEDEGRFPRG